MADHRFYRFVDLRLEYQRGADWMSNVASFGVSALPSRFSRWSLYVRFLRPI